MASPVDLTGARPGPSPPATCRAARPRSPDPARCSRRRPGTASSRRCRPAAPTGAAGRGGAGPGTPTGRRRRRPGRSDATRPGPRAPGASGSGGSGSSRRRCGSPRRQGAGGPVGRRDLLGRPVEDPRGISPLLADRDHPALGVGHLLGGPAQELPPVGRRVLLLVVVVARLAAVVVPRVPAVAVAAPGPVFRVERLLQVLAGIVGRPRACTGAGRRALQPRERGQDLDNIGEKTTNLACSPGFPASGLLETRLRPPDSGRPIREGLSRARNPEINAPYGESACRRSGRAAQLMRPGTRTSPGRTSGDQ